MGIKKIVSPYTSVLHGIARTIPVSPNTLTLSSIILSVLAAGYIISDNFLYGILFTATAFFLDGVDGIVARAKGKVTKFGAFFDGISDRIVEFFILTSMVFITWQDVFVTQVSILMIIGFGTFLTSFTKAYADHRETIKKSDTDKMSCILERTERVILILLALILYTYNISLSQYLLYITAILSFVSFIQRFSFVYSYNMK